MIGPYEPGVDGNASAPLRALEDGLGAGVLPRGTPLLLALSGGRDSSSLMHALCAVGAWPVSAAVVDHGLHAASTQHAEAAAASAAGLGVAARILAADAERVRAGSRGPEAAARDERFRLLSAHAHEIGARYIVTAHTADDQAETVLMRIGEGTGLRGLAGIPPQNRGCVRPWLTVARADVRAYARVHGVRYVHDPTNDDRRFLRNAVRGDVLPAMARCFDPRWAERAARTAENARGASELLDWLLARSPDLMRRRGEQVEVARDVLFDLPRGAQRALLDRALSAALDGGRSRRVHVERLLHLEVGAQCALPGGWMGRATRSTLVIEPPGPPMRADPPIVIDGPGDFQWSGWRLAVRAGRRIDSPSIVAFDAERAPFPWTVRPVRSGERMRPRGAPGRKGLTRLWADRGIARRWRAHMPVVESGGQVVWAAGLRASEDARVAPEAPAWLLDVTQPPHGPLDAG